MLLGRLLEAEGLVAGGAVAAGFVAAGLVEGLVAGWVTGVVSGIVSGIVAGGSITAVVVPGIVSGSVPAAEVPEAVVTGVVTAGSGFVLEGDVEGFWNRVQPEMNEVSNANIIKLDIFFIKPIPLVIFNTIIALLSHNSPCKMIT